MPILVQANMPKDVGYENKIEKLREEAVELMDELLDASKILGPAERIEYAHGKIAEEAFDVIQVCLWVLNDIEKETPGVVGKKNKEHIAKLIERGWDFKKVLNVD